MKSDIGKGLLNLPYDSEKQAYIQLRIENGDVQPIYLLNRLDSATSGILLLSASSRTREAVMKSLKNRKVTKILQGPCFRHYQT